MPKLYPKLLMLFAVILLFVFPTVYRYLGYKMNQWTGRNDGSINGDWVGKVHIESVTSALHASDPPAVDDQGDAILYVRVHPVLFSFLDRTDVQADLTDSHGIVKKFDIPDYGNGWCLPWGGSSGRLITTESDDMVVGEWNKSFLPFKLSFDSFTSDRYGRPRKYKLASDTEYQIQGKLARGTRDEYRNLVAGLLKPAN